MTDIAMCENKKCKLKETCYRFKTTPSEDLQYYFPFKPKNDKECDSYMKLYTPKQ